MKKLLGKIILIISICVVIIFSLFTITYFKMSPVFSDSYQRGFNYQYNALKRADDSPKIIVLGGSYMTFATDSSLLSNLSGMPSYTLGIHSGMGMCYILETAERFLNKDDIIVFSFNPFTKNDYGMDLIYLCFENDKDLFFDFLKKHPYTVIKTMSPSIYTKLFNGISNYVKYNILKKEKKITIYSADAFDMKSGNLIYSRPEISEDIPGEELIARIKYEISEIDCSCIDVLNSFNDLCEQYGAKMFITFSPVYEGSIVSSEEDIKRYERYLKERLKAPIISTIHDNLMPESFLYNAATHMNEKGAKAYTTQIVKDLCNYVSF